MSVHKFVFQYSKFAVRIKNKCIIKRSSSIHRLSTLRQVDTQKQLLMSKNILKQMITCASDLPLLWRTFMTTPMRLFDILIHWSGSLSGHLFSHYS